MMSANANTQLQKIQANFHEVIKSRAAKLIEEHNVSLPELKEVTKEQKYFPVPGMYGGFSYWFEGEGDDLKLITESWCRVVGGSGMRHEVTVQGHKLVAEGFVWLDFITLTHMGGGYFVCVCVCLSLLALISFFKLINLNNCKFETW